MDDTYQNPLYTQQLPVPATENAPTPPVPTPKFRLPQNKKIIAIIGLFGFTLILLFISTIVNAGRKLKPTINQPTPTIVAPSSPPTVNFQLVPESLKPQFDSIDQKIKNPSNFLPIHQIDQDIGLN
jgi:hypothetical protein